MVGLALALVFLSGAAGKFACGWLGARIGVLRTVLLTEGGTAIGIFAILLLPLAAALMLLPLLGVMLNGTSSVLYGTVPEADASPSRGTGVRAVLYRDNWFWSHIARHLRAIRGRLRRERRDRRYGSRRAGDFSARLCAGAAS